MSRSLDTNVFFIILIFIFFILKYYHYYLSTHSLFPIPLAYTIYN